MARELLRGRFPEWFFELLPAYKATRIIIEGLFESFPQLLLQAWILNVVINHVADGTASPAELAIFAEVQLLPKSILISSLALLKTFTEFVLTARREGMTIRERANLLWAMGEGLPLDAIKKNTITKLERPGFELPPTQVAMLKDALLQNTSLTVIDLGSCRIGAAGAQKLAHALELRVVLTLARRPHLLLKARPLRLRHHLVDVVLVIILVQLARRLDVSEVAQEEQRVFRGHGALRSSAHRELQAPDVDSSA